MWSRRFRARQSIRGSLWVLPLLAAVLGSVLAAVAVYFQGDLQSPTGWGYSADTAQTVLTTIVASAVGLTGFVVTVSVLVVQMATGTFSARYMRLWFRDRALRGVLAVSVGTVSFAFSLLRRVEEGNVPDLAVTFAGFLLGAALVLFLVFFDRVLHRMRPVKVAAIVARAGRRTMGRAAEGAAASADEERPELAAAPPPLVVHSRHPGAIQAIDRRGMVRWAEENGCVVVLGHAVGDFVSSGGALLEVYGPLADPGRSERRLRGMVALGVERTLEQDPAFALRILVDIAIRALSPAVNDPTTAVQVLDHLEDVLAVVGRTPGLGGNWEYRDGAGALRMVIPGQRWEDLLALGVTEIREYGAPSIQVARRLRATLEALRRTVLPEHVPAVDAELARLDLSVERSFGASPDADRARMPDRQGIGGPPPLDR
jgi:uncharacterized membrane protein